jgi:hypothetical protein
LQIAITIKHYFTCQRNKKPAEALGSSLEGAARPIGEGLSPKTIGGLNPRTAGALTPACLPDKLTFVLAIG